MRPSLLTFVVLLMVAPVQADDASREFLSGFVVGRYRLIGQQADAGTTYHGLVVIYRHGPSAALKVKRTIGGRTVEGTAAIESALHGDAKVLRMRFKADAAAYENTCLVQGDLDNYARLSCHLYRQDGSTQQAGLEALFAAPAE
jgi:hypothetical protein